MGETADQIESYIETQREDLHSNLKELETKLKSASDWRHYFRKYTGTMVAVAFGGGILVSTIVGKSRRTGASPAASSSLSPSKVHPSVRAHMRHRKPGTR
jgi:hypothetical protein